MNSLRRVGKLARVENTGSLSPASPEEPIGLQPSRRVGDHTIRFEQRCQLRDHARCAKDAAEPNDIGDARLNPFFVRGVPTKLRKFK